jgi:hypothetical protein
LTPLKGPELQRALVQLAQHHGWICAHFSPVQDIRGVWRTPARADGKGFPDLILVRDRLIAIEVKGDGDKMKPDQKKWMTAMLDAGIDFYIATPKNWRDGFFDAVLK